MKIISQDPGKSGAYPSIQEGNFSAVPPGTALWPDTVSTDTFYQYSGFVTLVIREEMGVPTVTDCEPNKQAWEAWMASLPPEPDHMYTVREAKLAELSEACSAAITAGCDVALSTASGHISLTAEDQINLSTATQAVDQGAAGYPYHLDSQLCVIFPAADIRIMAQAATAHKLYHTTYYNHLAAWVRHCETAEEVEAIVYGVALPEDLAANMSAIISAVGVNSV